MANVTIDGVEYAPVKKDSGNRAVVVADRAGIPGETDEDEVLLLSLLEWRE